MRITLLNKSRLFLAVIATAVLIAGCSGGSSSTTTTTTTATPLTPAGTPVVASPTLTLSIVDSAGASTTSISSSAPATVKAKLVDANGANVSNTVVTFTTDATLAAMTPTGGTALTDSSGVASITLSPASFTSAGAATITATAQVGTAAVNGSVGFSIGASTLTITPLTFGTGATALSAFGTTSITANVQLAGANISTPQIVDFTSPCASSKKASLSTGLSTIAGVAVASYRDMGCAGSDTITATVNGGLATKTATLVVTPPTVGSIQFVSASPELINLKGTGGTEASQVVFKVLDQGGNPISGKTVTFALVGNAVSGGITLTPSPSTAISDNNGLVQTIVNAGTVSTPVRVSASTSGATAATTLTSTSNALTITTGVPDQDSTSLSRTVINIEGWDYDGVQTVLTARLADHFNNPVPDGTPVNFTAEGGAVVSTCKTTAGACDATFTSQNFRPSNGRVTVLAYAVGEESFIDLNGSGWADITALTATNEITTDLAEAFVDFNENGTRDVGTEPFIDLNNDWIFTPADTKFSGVLCDIVTAGRSAAGSCAAYKTVHVRDSKVIVLSGSFADIVINGGLPVALNQCVTGTGSGSGAGVASNVIISVVDKNGNAMPAGTTVTVTTDNGTVVSGGSYTIQNTAGCRTGYAGCPASVASATFGEIPGLVLKGDAVYNPTAGGTCVNTTSSGKITVKVTTPKGNTTFSTPVTITD